MGRDSNLFLFTGTVEQQSAVTEVLDLIVKLYLLTPVYSGTQRTVFRECTFTFAICYCPSVCGLSSVCLSSVTFVRPTQAVQIFGNISMALGTLATN